MKVFISYTTRDEFVNSTSLAFLEEKLSHLGEIYIDILHNDSFNKQKRVIDEMESSDLVVCLNSHSISSSNWAMLEKQKAQELNLPIIDCPVYKNSNWALVSDFIKEQLFNHHKKRANKSVHPIACSARSG